MQLFLGFFYSNFSIFFLKWRIILCQKCVCVLCILVASRNMEYEFIDVVDEVTMFEFWF